MPKCFLFSHFTRRDGTTSDIALTEEIRPSVALVCPCCSHFLCVITCTMAELDCKDFKDERKWPSLVFNLRFPINLFFYFPLLFPLFIAKFRAVMINHNTMLKIIVKHYVMGRTVPVRWLARYQNKSSSILFTFYAV